MQVLYKEMETAKYDLEHSACVYGPTPLAYSIFKTQNRYQGQWRGVAQLGYGAAYQGTEHIH